MEHFNNAFSPRVPVRHARTPGVGEPFAALPRRALDFPRPQFVVVGGDVLFREKAFLLILKSAFSKIIHRKQLSAFLRGSNMDATFRGVPVSIIPIISSREAAVSGPEIPSRNFTPDWLAREAHRT